MIPALLREGQMKQKQFPLNNKSLNHNEENEESLALKPCPQKRSVFDVQDHENSGPCEKVLDGKEHERTLIQVESHDRIHFRRPPVHQFQGEKSIHHTEHEDHQNSGKRLCAVLLDCGNGFHGLTFRTGFVGLNWADLREVYSETAKPRPVDTDTNKPFNLNYL
jgi:hypothetical protein